MCFLCGGVAGGQSTLIDFSALASLPCNSSYGGPGAVFDGPSYATNGFVFSTNGSPTNAFETWCPGGGGYTGGPALFANQDYATLTLSMANGGLFSIQSISLATLYSGFTNPLNVQFTGTRADASQVSEVFTIPGGAALTAFSFAPTFVQLQSLSWQQGSTSQATSYQFDNVLVTSVAPEPGTSVLMTTGLVLVLARRRSRRRA
jgi:hypothetical protein